jgi:hypothetical protein
VRLQQDLPAPEELAPLVCILLESLPFLENSAHIAMATLKALLPVKADPVIVTALRRGTDACAAAFADVQRDALGDPPPALTSEATARYAFLSEELARRAATLEGRGRRRGTGKACAEAGQWLQRLQEAAGEDRDSALAARPRATAVKLFTNAVLRAEVDADSAAEDVEMPTLPLELLGPCAHTHDADLAAFNDLAERWPLVHAPSMVEVPRGGSVANRALAAMLPPALGDPGGRAAPASAAVAALLRKQGGPRTWGIQVKTESRVGDKAAAGAMAAPKVSAAVQGYGLGGSVRATVGVPANWGAAARGSGVNAHAGVNVHATAPPGVEQPPLAHSSSPYPAPQAAAKPAPARTLAAGAALAVPAANGPPRVTLARAASQGTSTAGNQAQPPAAAETVAALLTDPDRLRALLASNPKFAQISSALMSSIAGKASTGGTPKPE